MRKNSIIKTINIQYPMGHKQRLIIPEKYRFLVNHLSPEMKASIDAENYPKAECSFCFVLPESFQFSDDKDELLQSIKWFLINTNEGMSRDFYLWCLQHSLCCVIYYNEGPITVIVQSMYSESSGWMYAKVNEIILENARKEEALRQNNREIMPFFEFLKTMRMTEGSHAAKYHIENLLYVCSVDSEIKQMKKH